jgi:predicted TPR repeat methyltransferase
LALACVAHVFGYFNEDIDAAIAIIDRSLALNPSSAYGWRWSGFLRLYAGKPDLAIGHFETSLRLNPRDLHWAQLTDRRLRPRGEPDADPARYRSFFSGRLEKAAATLLLALQENPA